MGYLHRAYYESANRMFFTLENAQNSRMKAHRYVVTKAHICM